MKYSLTGMTIGSWKQAELGSPAILWIPVFKLSMVIMALIMLII